MDKKSDLITLLDWMQFTIPHPFTLDDIYDLLKIPKDEFKDMPRGLYSYTKQRAAGDIRIMFEGRSDMGIHVQLSGDGCRQYETYYDSDWYALMLRIMEANGKFTRLDIAVDDIRYKDDPAYFTLRQLIAKVKRNECKSKFKTARRVETLTISGGKSKGQTIYFGSSVSDIQVRAYEKDFERIHAGKELEEGLTAWNRVELELHNERADNTVLAMLTGYQPGEIAFGILSHYMDF